MTLQDTTQTVTVSTDTVQLSVDPESNQSATVITGDALNALSDDPDELSAELSALAGPSMGPNGGQIYIDGFTGRATASEVVDPRDSHQPESLLRTV